MFKSVKPWWDTKVSLKEREQFDPLAQEDGGEYHVPQDPLRFRNRLRAMLVPTALLLFIVSTFFNTVLIVKQLKSTDKHDATLPDWVAAWDITTQGPVRASCGTTVASAIAAGCTFDMVATGWLHPICYEEPMAFQAGHGVQHTSNHSGIGPPEYGLTQWSWYEDGDFAHPLRTNDELIKFLAEREQKGLTPTAFVDASFHQAHCAYMGRLATHAVERLWRGDRDVWVLNWAATASHSTHCEHVFGELQRASPADERRKHTEVTFGMADCMLVG